MQPYRIIYRPSLAISFTLALVTGALAQNSPPRDFKIAFLGDQGLGPAAENVLKLVKSENAQIIVHLGDFDYHDRPSAWEAQTNKILGPDFPQFSVMGNHDESKWASDTGYGAVINRRMQNQGITDLVGVYGKQCSFHYKGIFFVFTTPGLDGTGHDTFIRAQLAKDNSVWRISSWHVLQKLMQVGGKSDEAGWPVYEASREGGAIIATAHEHIYCRTHLMSSMINQTIASKDSTLHIGKGKTFAFVQGIGGSDPRPQLLSGDWWASIYTQNQNAVPGILFGVFNTGGIQNRADFYFKDIQGKIVDKFSVVSELGTTSALVQVGKNRFAFENPNSSPSKHRSGVWALSGKSVGISTEKDNSAYLPKASHATGLVFFETQSAQGNRSVHRQVILP
jgi:hypothetical protein